MPSPSVPRARPPRRRRPEGPGARRPRPPGRPTGPGRRGRSGSACGAGSCRAGGRDRRVHPLRLAPWRPLDRLRRRSARRAVMVVGEAPGREEDRAGHPFAGTAGAMLDRMFAAIGLSVEAEARAQALYLVGADALETAVAGADERGDRDAGALPEASRGAGGAASGRLHGRAAGQRSCWVSRAWRAARGGWREAGGRPALAIHHPATLMRRPELKREAWADLLMLRAKLQEGLTT